MFDATPQSAGAALACKWTAILAQVLLVQGVTSIQEFACDSQDCIRETRRSEEPRLGRHGFFALRWGDESKPAQGRPQVPAKYRGHILAKPLEATITGLSPSQA